MAETIVATNTLADPVIIDEDAPLIVVQAIDTNYPGGSSSSPIQYTATAISLPSEKRLSIVPKAGALVWDTDLKLLYVGDGVTVGGVALDSSAGPDFSNVVFHDEN